MGKERVRSIEAATPLRLFSALITFGALLARRVYPHIDSLQPFLSPDLCLLISLLLLVIPHWLFFGLWLFSASPGVSVLKHTISHGGRTPQKDCCRGVRDGGHRLHMVKIKGLAGAQGELASGRVTWACLQRETTEIRRQSREYDIVVVGGGEETHLAHNRVGLPDFFEHRKIENLYLNPVTWVSITHLYLLGIGSNLSSSATLVREHPRQYPQITISTRE